MKYEWENTETGEVVEHDHWSVPPDKSGEWRRLYIFGTGRVVGAGGSPAQSSTRLKKPFRGSKSTSTTHFPS